MAFFWAAHPGACNKRKEINSYRPEYVYTAEFAREFVPSHGQLYNAGRLVAAKSGSCCARQTKPCELLAGLQMRDSAGSGRHTCRLRIAAPGTAPPTGRGRSFVVVVVVVVVGAARANPSERDGRAGAARLPLRRLPQAPLSPHTSGLAIGKPRKALQHSHPSLGEFSTAVGSAIQTQHVLSTWNHHAD